MERRKNKSVGSVKKNQISKCCILFRISDDGWHTDHSNSVLFLCLSNKKIMCSDGICMYVWGVGHKLQPFHHDLQWSIVLFRWYKYQFCSYSQTLSLCAYQLAFEWIRPEIWLTQVERLLNLVLKFCKILCRVCHFRHLCFIYWFSVL
jgi:hypothetical protein